MKLLKVFRTIIFLKNNQFAQFRQKIVEKKNLTIWADLLNRSVCVSFESIVLVATPLSDMIKNDFNKKIFIFSI